MSTLSALQLHADIFQTGESYDTVTVDTSSISSDYCKTLFFRRNLILRFPYVENFLQFNFADFPVNFIKQFVSVSFGASNKY